MTSPGARRPLDAGSLFAMLWCAALLAHYDTWASWRMSPWDWAGYTLAGVGLILPHRARVFALVLGAQAVAWADRMPHVDNHWMVATFVGAALLPVAMGASIRGGDWDREAFDRVAPTLRRLAVAVYAFAALHKLNAGFLDPEVSCASMFWDRARDAPFFPPLPELGLQARGILAHGIVALEVVAAVGLAWRRTWWIGIAAGVVFHATTTVFMRHFPTIMLTLYVAFLPETVLVRVTQWFTPRRRAAFVGAVLMFTAWSLALASTAAEPPEGPMRAATQIQLRLWTVVMTVAVGTAFLSAKRLRVLGPRARAAPRPRRWWSLEAVTVVFALNALSPYLGLKQATSLAMWSNLRTHSGESNHLFLPVANVFPFLADTVEVRASNDRVLRDRYVGPQRHAAWISFQRDVAAQATARPGRAIRVRYVRGGDTVATPDAARVPEIAAEQPWWVRKLVHVDPLDMDRRGRCAW